jgi:hypothetical protein
LPVPHILSFCKSEGVKYDSSLVQTQYLISLSRSTHFFDRAEKTEWRAAIEKMTDLTQIANLSFGYTKIVEPSVARKQHSCDNKDQN